MQTLIGLFAILQAIGAAIGAGGSVFAELFYLQAIRDGHIDVAEKRHMRTIAKTLRAGMLTVLTSSIALVLLAFIYDRNPQPAFTTSYWILMILAFVVIFGSWALSRKKMGATLAAAIAFMGWWFIALLAFGRFPAMSVTSTIGLFVVATAIMAAILHFFRTLHRKS